MKMEIFSHYRGEGVERNIKLENSNEFRIKMTIKRRYNSQNVFEKRFKKQIKVINIHR